MALTLMAALTDIIHFDHIDPITIIIIAIGVVGSWYLQKGTVKWHSEWIREHDKDCKDHREDNQKLLAELKAITAHLVTLTETHGDRLNRIENLMDRTALGRRDK